MKRSPSQSSSSSHSALWTEKNDFQSHEDLFYQPPTPEEPSYPPKLSQDLACEDVSEGHIHALLDVMSDWCIEPSEESASRFYKPLPPPPVEESDDEDAIRKPFGAARALRKVMESTEQVLSMPSTPPLRLKSSKASAASTPSTVTPEPKTPTTFLLPQRPSADVPRTPISETFFDPPMLPSPRQSWLRARSSSLPPCPPPGLRSAHFEHYPRRPPPLKPSARSLGSIQEQILHPAFNKSFSAPNTPTAADFMDPKTDRRSSHLLYTRQSPYSQTVGHLAREDSHFPTGNNSRWSLSTLAQDDEPQSFLSPPSSPTSPRRGLPRSPSRLGLNLKFSKFDLSKLVRLPSRAGNKKRLIAKGIAPGQEVAVQRVKTWCEEFGAVNRVSQKPNGEIHIHFRNRVVAERVCRTHTNVEIAGVGAVSLSYDWSSKHK